MLIANPIYDVVFKYMMDDNKVAKLFLGAILGIEITELECKPQEITTLFPKSEDDSLERKNFVQVLRLDFKATVSYPDGTKRLVLIELQKAKMDTDAMRFRRYLGTQYADPKNAIPVNNKEKPLPIITIYFLGYTLKNIENIPVVRVKRQYLDNYSGEEILVKEDFIEELSHDMLLIQLPLIKYRKRDKLEQILSIFEERNLTVFDMRHPIPPEYEPILERLHSALNEEEVRHARLAQEELLYEFSSRDKMVEEALALAEQAETKKKEAETREKNALASEKRAVREKKEALVMANQAETRETETLKKAIQNLISKSTSIAEIAAIFNRSEEEINKLIS